MNVHMAEWLWLLEGDWERRGSRFELPDSKSYSVLCLFINFFFFKGSFFLTGCHVSGKFQQEHWRGQRGYNE